MAKKELLDSDANSRADRICDHYFMGDPNVTFEMAQQAAIDGQKLNQQLDKLLGTGFAITDQFARERLVSLGVNPDTLQPIKN